MTKLLLIRHFEPILDPDNPPSKWEFSDRGRQRAQALGAYLLENGTTALYSSQETKAFQTAKHAGTVAGLSTVAIQDFREHDREKIAIIGSDREHRARVIDCIRKPDELVLGSETVGAALKRFAAAIHKIMEPVDAIDHERTVAVVSHGTVISVFIAGMLGIDPIPVWESLGLPGLVEIDWPNPSKITNQRNFD